ncbi:MAG TPA: hypothetical protein PLL49_04750, partial [Bacteroidales bacterium]|nr:hypothetical protein [Bacteroidales bacterium]
RQSNQTNAPQLQPNPKRRYYYFFLGNKIKGGSKGVTFLLSDFPTLEYFTFSKTLQILDLALNNYLRFINISML